MKVIIAGGRNVFLTDKNKAFLDTLIDVIDEIVSGHAKGIDPGRISPSDGERLESLGFVYSSEHDCMVSYRFGSS